VKVPEGELELLVFLGPSLAPALRPALRNTRWLPPIKRGDLKRLEGEGLAPPTRIAIIDGEFAQSLAVSPRELLDALKKGFQLFGSSSMGALRAAELHTLGMQGVGRIFELYRDNLVVADDEVAIVFDPDSHRALSEPLVNIRCAAECLLASDELDPASAARILEIAQALPYPERHYRRIEKLAAEQAGASLAACVRRLTTFDQKRDDALSLLRLLASD
jgi:hypothetical protein